MIDISRFGYGVQWAPACMFPFDVAGGNWPTGNCNPIELTIRHSFRKVIDTDYEPKNWDGYRFLAYGAFTVNRMGFEDSYRITDKLWRRFITRYNIWERSHYYEDSENMKDPVECYTVSTTPFGSDPHRDVDDNGTEDECETVGKGSRCDEFKRMCTLPFQQRETKQIVWYYTNNDNKYFDATAIAAHDWDVALRVAVRSAKYAECENTGTENCVETYPVYFGQQENNDDAVSLANEVDDCKSGKAYTDRNKEKDLCNAIADEIGAKRGYDKGVISIAKMDEMIVLCHSPVEFEDHEACGNNRLPEGIKSEMCLDSWKEPGSNLYLSCENALNVRMGDLRFHQVNVISKPQSPSPWGLYADTEDPLTGETIAARINLWSSVTDYTSQRILDVLRYMNGELKDKDITNGKYIHKWSDAAQKAGGVSGFLPMLSKDEVNTWLKDFTGLNADDVANWQLPSGIMDNIKQLNNEARNIKASITANSVLAPVYNTRAKNAAGTDFEASLMTDMVQQYMGISGSVLNDSIMDYVSPLRGGNPNISLNINNLKEIALANRGACILHESSHPTSFNGLDIILQEKFGKFNPEDDESKQYERALKMKRYISNNLHRSVIVHEMGHSVGARHNFVSSSDAFGYKPQYWQLRTRNGDVVAQCWNKKENGNGCAGPRFYDPVTEEERNSLIWMWMQSSVMDYAGEFTQQFAGLGVWDFAAAKMYYGDTATVFADSEFGSGGMFNPDMSFKMDNFGGILGFKWGNEMYQFHYSQLQKRYKLINNCKTVDDVNIFKPGSWDETVSGKWHPVLDGHIVKVKNNYSRCETLKVDYVPWNSLTEADRVKNENKDANHFYDKKNRIRVPYGFASDNWADLGNVSVYRNDNGADPYELFDFLIGRQEVNHIFDNYRRGSASFSVRNASNRTLIRYNAKIRDGVKGLGLIKNVYSWMADDAGMNYDNVWPFVAIYMFADNIISAGMAFDHFTKILARPQSGEHYQESGSSILRSTKDTVMSAKTTVVTIPNGATGFFRDVGYGGRPLENGMSNSHGDYNNMYTDYCGSYYEKMFSSMLLTESVDRFISSRRTDFLDARYRAVSLADLFPKGFRRWLGNNLTGDTFIKGPRIVADENGKPITDDKGYPIKPIGWVSWWGNEARVCFPSEGSRVCSSLGVDDSSIFGAENIENLAVLDPQVGWEQQKFLIVWTLMYIPENQKQFWIDNLRMWELGEDADPQIERRIELHYPDGKNYIAKAMGKETIFGKTVHMGVAARVLEYANELINQAYDNNPVDYDNDGQTDWYVPLYNEITGLPLVKYDSTISSYNINQQPVTVPDCNEDDNSGCDCAANRACIKLRDYMSVPFLIRQALHYYGLAFPTPKGVF